MLKVTTSRFDGTPASRAAASSLLDALCGCADGLDPADPGARMEAMLDRRAVAQPESAFFTLNLSAIPADERPALAAILQATVDRLARPMATEDEEAVLRELLGQHMRGLIGDAAKAGA